MTNDSGTSSPTPLSGKRWQRALLLRLTAVIFSVLMMVLFIEAALRLVPQMLPTGHYGAGKFNEELQLNVHGSNVIYNKVRFVQRTPNSDGFMDVEHSKTKTSGIYRIGFFGDSYVESIQLPLEETFFRRAEKLLGNDKAETFSLGISGWGTLHSYLAYGALADDRNLDAVVYVFVSNDVGDNSFALQRRQGRSRTPSPTAVPSIERPGFELRWPVDPDKLPLSYRIGKTLQRNSLLVRLLHSRLALIIKTRSALDPDAPLQPRMFQQRRLNENDPPSTWPPEILREATEVSERILMEFAIRVQEDGRRFFVLYVPNGLDEVDGKLPEKDTWLPWIETITRRLNVPLLNPIDALRNRQASGVPMYDDHWSPEGHEVIAEFLAEKLCREIPAIKCRGAQVER